MSCPLYARLEKGEKGACYEYLVDHLKGVAVTAYKLYRGLGFTGREVEVVAASLFHDIGKILYNIGERVACIEPGKALGKLGSSRLAFPYHEVFSAALLGSLSWTASLPEHEEEGLRMAIRAVLMHHQGLRGVSAHTYQDGLAHIGSIYGSLSEEDRNMLASQISSTVRQAYQELLNNMKELKDVLNSLVKLVEEFSNQYSSPENIREAIDSATRLLPEWVKVEEKYARDARIVTGILMVADNAVARNSMEALEGCKGSASRYVEEAYWLYKHLARRSKCFS